MRRRGKVTGFGGLAGVLTAAILVGCQTEAPPDSQEEVEQQAQVVLLSPREQLIRLSMDLRGVHPSETELAAIEAQPGLYDDYVDRYLQDPRFLDRMTYVFNLAFHTRTRQLYFGVDDTNLDGLDTDQLAREIGEEPLRLVRHIIDNDLPYSDVITAPFSFATPMVASFWHMDYPVGEEGWQQAQYKDGRPHMGVLSMSTFWQRYPSMGGNANRHRANAVSRIFLCDDFLVRPIVVNRTAVDQLAEDPETAIRTSDTCQSCHASLDPLASHFFGFFNEFEELEEARTYRPENELLWKEYSGKSPGYFGRPTTGLAELGEAITSDPRFSRCAVSTVFSGVTQRSVNPDDWTELAEYQAVFEDSDMNVRELVRAIVSADVYRAARIDGDEALASRVSTVKTASPEQLAATIEAITGYSWTFGGADGLADNALGLAVLAGGVDSRTVLKPTHDPSVGVVFVQERLAQAAAYYVVRHDFSPDRDGEAFLMAYVSPDDTPDSNPEGFALQIRELYLRATGIPIAEDAPEIVELTQLWIELHSMSASVPDAWVGVVSAVLRDPRILFY